MMLLVALCECAFAYWCLGVVYPCGMRGCPCMNNITTLSPPLRFCSALVVYPKEVAARALGCSLY